MDYLPMNSNQLVKVAFLKKRLDSTLCNSFKASRERKVFLGTDEVKASSTSLEVQFWKSCKNAKENSLRCCFTSIKYLVAYSKPSSSLKSSDFPRLSINTQTVRFSFVMIMMKSKALHWENFSFFVGIATTTEFFQDLLWPNMENVKVSFMFTLMAKLLSFSLVFFNILHPAVFGQIFFCPDKNG